MKLTRGICCLFKWVRVRLVSWLSKLRESMRGLSCSISESSPFFSISWKLSFSFFSRGDLEAIVEVSSGLGSSPGKAT